jgi:PAS domain S-box-containing protein
MKRKPALSIWAFGLFGALVPLITLAILLWARPQSATVGSALSSDRGVLVTVLFTLVTSVVIIALMRMNARYRALLPAFKSHHEELSRRDSFDRKRTEDALLQERFLVETLMDNITDHIYFKDCQSRFLRVNRAMARRFKLSDPAEAIGKTDCDFFTTEHAQQALNDEQEIIRTGKPMVDREEKETWPDGSVSWVSTTKHCFRDSHGEIIGTFGLSRDITARKEAEEALARKADELARSNLELEQFAYVASHDLQEPLRMIASYTQLLARRYGDRLDADANEFINYAVEGATRMQVLINDLLSYSRLGTRGKPFAATDCNEALARALQNLKIAIQETKAAVSTSKLPVILGDGGQLTQLFQNLISNALKFRGAEAPVVHIKAELKPVQDHGSDDASPCEWVFSIRDNGMGIEPEYHERIFIIFQRLHTRDQYPGTGIGLAVCKKIVERHGGRIWLESALGSGTTFFFTAPQMIADA